MIYRDHTFISGFRWHALSMQKGFALVSAIFLLVVLAGLGVAMFTFSTAQQTSSGLDVMGSRAYQAARAGIEWGLYQRLNPPVAAPNTPSTYCSSQTVAVTNTLSMPTGTTLSPFTVTVICTPTYSAAATLTVRTITSTACNQPTGGVCPNPSPSGTDYVQRVVQVSIQQ